MCTILCLNVLLIFVSHSLLFFILIVFVLIVSFVIGAHTILFFSSTVNPLGDEYFSYT